MKGESGFQAQTASVPVSPWAVPTGSADNANEDVRPARDAVPSQQAGYHTTHDAQRAQQMQQGTAESLQNMFQAAIRAVQTGAFTSSPPATNEYGRHAGQGKSWKDVDVWNHAQSQHVVGMQPGIHGSFWQDLPSFGQHNQLNPQGVAQQRNLFSSSTGAWNKHGEEQKPNIGGTAAALPKVSHQQLNYTWKFDEQLPGLHEQLIRGLAVHQPQTQRQPLPLAVQTHHQSLQQPRQQLPQLPLLPRYEQPYASEGLQHLVSSLTLVQLQELLRSVSHTEQLFASPPRIAQLYPGEAVSGAAGRESEIPILQPPSSSTTGMISQQAANAAAAFDSEVQELQEASRLILLQLQRHVGLAEGIRQDLRNRIDFQLQV